MRLKSSGSDKREHMLMNNMIDDSVVLMGWVRVTQHTAGAGWCIFWRTVQSRVLGLVGEVVFALIRCDTRAGFGCVN